MIGAYDGNSFRYSRIGNFSERLKDLLVCGSFFIIRFDEAPADDPPPVENVGGGMRPAFVVRVEDAVAVDDLVIFVFKQWEIEIARESLLELLHKFFRCVVTVDADREDLNLILFFRSQKFLQLTELLSAVGSPLASIKHQDNFLFIIDFRQCNSPPVHVLQREVRRDVPDFNPFQIGGL
jgi:hypothetical protein